MNANWILQILVLGLALPASANPADGKVVAVTEPTCAAIQSAIDSLPPELPKNMPDRLSRKSGTVVLPAGKFLCDTSVVIARSDVKLVGAGRNKTIVQLKQRKHLPLFVIGHTGNVMIDGRPLPPIEISNIEVSDLTFDGGYNWRAPRQKFDAKKECGDRDCGNDATSIRNNAMTIRRSVDVVVRDVEVRHSLSGGLVTEKDSRRLKVIRLVSKNNKFDGFAGYETFDSEFIDVELKGNQSAGISIDIDFNNNRFIGGRIHSNSDMAIYARHITGNTFENMKIFNNGTHGVYFGMTDEWTHLSIDKRCATNNVLRNVEIMNNQQLGISLDPHCRGNTLEGNSQVINNGLAVANGQQMISGGRCVNADARGALIVKAPAVCE